MPSCSILHFVDWYSKVFCTIFEHCKLKSNTKYFLTFELQVRSFFSSKDVGAGELALKQTLEEIQINIEFRKKYEQKISEWLDENVS